MDHQNDWQGRAMNDETELYGEDDIVLGHGRKLFKLYILHRLLKHRH